MHTFQQDIFADNSDLGLLLQENIQLRNAISSIRRGLFTRLHAQEKEINSVKEELERLRGLVVETKVG